MRGGRYGFGLIIKANAPRAKSNGQIIATRNKTWLGLTSGSTTEHRNDPTNHTQQSNTTSEIASSRPIATILGHPKSIDDGAVTIMAIGPTNCPMTPAARN